MKVRARLTIADMSIDEVFTGNNADAIVIAMRAFGARKAPLLLRPVINAMPPLKIATEATRQYNTETGKQVPMPATCEAFLESGVAEGFFEKIAD